jgi:hypothetical protein
MLTVPTCPECYATNSRISPLLNPEDCLLHHRQYICHTCGRCICADVDDKGRFRALFPFKTLEIAKLYLRAAEVIWEQACGIYEIEDTKDRKHYKIFPSTIELNDYLQKNKQKHCNLQKPLFITPLYKACLPEQLRKLSVEETTIYIKERITSLV